MEFMYFAFNEVRVCFVCEVFPALIKSHLIVDAMIKGMHDCGMYTLSYCRLVMYVIVT